MLTAKEMGHFPYCLTCVDVKIKFLRIFFFVECRYKGSEYEAGSRFPSGDGCNECICTTQGIPQCTKYKCYPGMYNIVFQKRQEWPHHYKTAK